jgi:hypothetical protein
MFHNMGPLLYLLTAVVGISLVAQPSMEEFSAFASESSPYDSGYEHGCDDAGISDPGDRYINQPEKGPSFHTEEFMNGYDAGFNSCRSGGGGGDDFYQPPSEAPSDRIPREIQPGPRDDGDGTQQGGIDWNAACQAAHTFLNLQTPCDQLVTPNNELTEEGEKALACYLGGALLPLVNPATAAQLYTLGKQICPK